MTSHAKTTAAVAMAVTRMTACASWKSLSRVRENVKL